MLSSKWVQYRLNRYFQWLKSMQKRLQNEISFHELDFPNNFMLKILVVVLILFIFSVIIYVLLQATRASLFVVDECLRNLCEWKNPVSPRYQLFEKAILQFRLISKSKKLTGFTWCEHFVCTPLLYFFIKNYLFLKIKRRVHIFIFFDKVVSFLFECLSQWLQYYNPHISAANVFKWWGSLAKSLMNTVQHELKGRHL